MLRRLLLSLLGFPAAFNCQPERPAAEAGETHGGVRLVLQLASTQYHLLHKSGRFPPLMGHQTSDPTALVAYRIVQHDPPLAAPPYQKDTVEVAVTPAQAARLVALTQTYFAQAPAPASDPRPDWQEAGDTAALAGRLLLTGAGRLGPPVEVGRLDARSGDQQRAAFFRVEEGFAQLFDELPAN